MISVVVNGGDITATTSTRGLVEHIVINSIGAAFGHVAVFIALIGLPSNSG